MADFPPLFKRLPPAQIFLNEASGAVTSYRIQGQIQGQIKGQISSGMMGPALLFLHGFNGSSQSWACQFEHFADRIVIAVDAPGFGQSHAHEGGMAQTADEIAALLAHLGIAQAVIIGHSMGGMLGQVLAARHGDICAALVLSCTHKGRAQPLGTPLGPAVLERIEQRENMDDAPYGALRVRKMLAPDADSYVAPDIMAFLAAVAGQIKTSGIRSGGMAMHHLDTTSLLSAILVPVLIITAELDIVVMASASAALKAGLPKAQTVHLAGVGHAPYCENAGRFNAALDHFFDGCVPAAL